MKHYFRSMTEKSKVNVAIEPEGELTMDIDTPRDEDISQEVTVKSEVSDNPSSTSSNRKRRTAAKQTTKAPKSTKLSTKTKTTKNVASIHPDLVKINNSVEKLRIKKILKPLEQSGQLLFRIAC